MTVEEVEGKQQQQQCQPRRSIGEEDEEKKEEEDVERGMSLLTHPTNGATGSSYCGWDTSASSITNDLDDIDDEEEEEADPTAVKKEGNSSSNAMDAVSPTMTAGVSSSSASSSCSSDDEFLDEHDPLTMRRHQQDRRCGLLLFLAGLMGVILAVILISVHHVLTQEEEQPESSSQSNKNNSNARDNWNPFLLALPPDTLAQLEFNPESPQGRAYQWLREDPNFEEHEVRRSLQRFALAVLFYSTNGNAWANPENNNPETRRSAFLSHDIHECDWLPALNSTLWGCNEGGAMTSLGLPIMGLGGTLPAELWLLLAPDTLERVDFSQNDGLQGSLGTEIGVLQKLSSLDISETQLSGSIPSELGLCSSLTKLLLQHKRNDRLVGSIPTEVGQLSHLEEFVWNGTAVSGPIPSELGLLTAVKKLHLAHNQLTGTIPKELFSSATASSSSPRTASVSSSSSLQELQLHNNKLTGTIPSEITQVQTTLTVLALGQNPLDATALPTYLGTLTELADLQLYHNGWTGVIPTELGLLSSHLEVLALNHNSLTGSIVTEFLLLTNLQTLHLNNNPNLQGHIVEEEDSHNGLALGRLSNLEELTLNGTPVSGVVPESLCQTIELVSFVCDPEVLCGCDCACDDGDGGGNEEEDDVNVEEWSWIDSCSYNCHGILTRGFSKASSFLYRACHIVKFRVTPGTGFGVVVCRPSIRFIF
jgi:hypothetical protein